MDDPAPHLSIVVPLYNAAATLPALHREISALEVEGGHELIRRQRRQPRRDGSGRAEVDRESQLPMTFLSLSRNFGEHNAVLAGLRAVSGRYVVTMDDDLQNPPSEALKLLAVAEAEKRDVVFAIYDRKEHAWWRNAGSRLTNLIADFVVDKPRGALPVQLPLPQPVRGGRGGEIAHALSLHRRPHFPGHPKRRHGAGAPRRAGAGEQRLQFSQAGADCGSACS